MRFPACMFLESFWYVLDNLAKSRSSHWRCSVKNSVLENCLNFTGRHLCWSLFLNKVTSLRPGTLLNRVSNTGVFLWNLTRFWEHLFWRTSVNNCFCKHLLWVKFRTTLLISWWILIDAFYLTYVKTTAAI